MHGGVFGVGEGNVQLGGGLQQGRQIERSHVADEVVNQVVHVYELPQTEEIDELPIAQIVDIRLDAVAGLPGDEMSAVHGSGGRPRDVIEATGPAHLFEGR